MAITHKNLQIKASKALPDLLKERLILHGTEEVDFTKEIDGFSFTLKKGACKIPPCEWVSIVTPGPPPKVIMVCRCPGN